MNRMNNEFAVPERMQSDDLAYQQSPHRIEEAQHPNESVFNLKNLSVYLADQSIGRFDHQLSQLQLNESTNAHVQPMVTSKPTLKRPGSSSHLEAFEARAKRRLVPSYSTIDSTICANFDKAESERMTMVDDPVKLLRLKLQQVVDQHKSNYTMAIEAASIEFQAEHPEVSPIIVYSISKSNFFLSIEKMFEYFLVSELEFLSGLWDPALNDPSLRAKSDGNRTETQQR